MQALSRSFICKLLAIAYILSVSCSADDDPTGGLSAPETLAATEIAQTGFTINWIAVPNAKAYQLDVSTDNFATFLPGYEAKTVTDTKESVTGVTAGTTYYYRVRAIGDTGISEYSIEATVTTTFLPVANINSVSFTPTDVRLTDTRVGYELRMKNATNDITFRLPSKKDGTYDFIPPSPFGRKNSFPELAFAIWTSNGETYHGGEGSVTISTVGGKVSLMFNVNGTNLGDTKVSSIKNGNIQNLFPVATPVNTSQCALTTYSETSDGQTITGTFGYDSEGKLIQFSADGLTWNYFWSNGKIERALYISDFEFRQEVWTYQNNLLTKITGLFILDFGDFGADGTYVNNYTYTGDKLTKLVQEFNQNGIPSTVTNTLTYSGDNVATVGYKTVIPGVLETSVTTYTYSGFDGKNNMWQMFSKSLNNPLPMHFTDEVDARPLSKNNVGKISKPGPMGPIDQAFTYPAYSAGGYPTSMTYTSADGNSTSKATYIGCN